MMFFPAGLLAGLGLAAHPDGEVIGGAVLLSVLCLGLAMLARGVERARHHAAMSDDSAGDISLRAFFDKATDGIFRTTPDGRYTTANQALADIYGYASPQELTARLTDVGAQLYVEPGRRDAFRARVDAEGVVTGFVSEIYQHSGKRIWISVNARAVYDTAGKLLGYEGTVQDVTEKVEKERALRSALRQAEIASRMKAAFLAAMSHELKTPLNAVLGFSEIIRDEVLGPVGNAAYREYAGDIHTSGVRLLAVINDVLDVSRLEGGLLTIDARPEDVRDIIDRAISLARNVTRDPRDIIIDIAANMPLLHVDPARLAQAIGNLLANALKFTPQDGMVRVGARAEPGGGATLLVEDTGIGMSEDTIAAALEPFHQHDATLARRFEGAGLGLSLARALVGLHDGQLEIISAAGAGTTVLIHLPPHCMVATAPRMLTA